MTKIKCFNIEESASYPGKWLIKPIHNNFYLNNTTGSYNIICARLLSINYADYLRLCRDSFGAEIIGKNSKYPVAYFKRGEQVQGLVDLLNARANAILWDRTHPDYEQHLQFIKNKAPRFYEKIINNNVNSL